MPDRTSTKNFYATVIGRTVIFLARGKMTKQKHYREPVIVDKRRYANKAAAETAAKHWQGLLV